MHKNIVVWVFSLAFVLASMGATLRMASTVGAAAHVKPACGLEGNEPPCTTFTNLISHS
jgi:hypothetical protein